MKPLKDEIIKMRYITLVKKGLIDDDCTSYTDKIDINECVFEKVDKFKDYFIPGTVLISENASYKLRVHYPIE